MSSAARQFQVVYEVPAENQRWLLEEEDVPESPLHDAILLLLVEILVGWKIREGRNALIGRNIALRWNVAAPRQGVDPDVYIVEPPPPEGEATTSLCTWKPGHHPPRVAVEVVSENSAEKDYGDGPDRYAVSGTRELWVFDPLVAGAEAANGEARGGPHVLQVWRRDAAGAFRRVYAGPGPARSEELAAWLVVVDGGRRLRLSDDPSGEKLWLTEAEAERAAKEAERTSKDKERAAKEKAEVELAQVRGELEKLRRERG